MSNCSEAQTAVLSGSGFLCIDTPGSKCAALYPGVQTLWSVDAVTKRCVAAPSASPSPGAVGAGNSSSTPCALDAVQICPSPSFRGAAVSCICVGGAAGLGTSNTTASLSGRTAKSGVDCSDAIMCFFTTSLPYALACVGAAAVVIGIILYLCKRRCCPKARFCPAQACCCCAWCRPAPLVFGDIDTPLGAARPRIRHSRFAQKAAPAQRPRDLESTDIDARALATILQGILIDAKAGRESSGAGRRRLSPTKRRASLGSEPHRARRGQRRHSSGDGGHVLALSWGRDTHPPPPALRRGREPPEEEQLRRTMEASLRNALAASMSSTLSRSSLAHTLCVALSMSDSAADRSALHPDRALGDDAAASVLAALARSSPALREGLVAALERSVPQPPAEGCGESEGGAAETQEPRRHRHRHRKHRDKDRGDCGGSTAGAETEEAVDAVDSREVDVISTPRTL